MPFVPSFGSNPFAVAPFGFPQGRQDRQDMHHCAPSSMMYAIVLGGPEIWGAVCLLRQSE
jgi:hypothetical protein